MFALAIARTRDRLYELPSLRRWNIPYGLWFPLAIFAATRVVSFIMFTLEARNQGALPHTYPHSSNYYYVNTPMPASPGYLSVITNWDGQWYERIATRGYGDPSSLPSAEAFAEGHAWAFPPLFPLVARIVMGMTGMGFGAAATVVTIAAGAAAMVMIFLLLERTAGPFVASALVATTCAFISAPLLQAAYSESLALFFLSASLLLIQRCKYGFALIAITALALTRLITPPLAVVIAAHAWSRYQQRAETPVRWKEIIGMLGVGLMSIGGLSLWSRIAAGWLSAPEGTEANRGSVSALSAVSFGWFGAAYRAWGFAGLGSILIMALMLVLLAYDERATTGAQRFALGTGRTRRIS